MIEICEIDWINVLYNKVKNDNRYNNLKEAHFKGHVILNFNNGELINKSKHDYD